MTCCRVYIYLFLIKISLGPSIQLVIFPEIKNEVRFKRNVLTFIDCEIFYKNNLSILHITFVTGGKRFTIIIDLRKIRIIQ